MLCWSNNNTGTQGNLRLEALEATSAELRWKRNNLPIKPRKVLRFSEAVEWSAKGWHKLGTFSYIPLIPFGTLIVGFSLTSSVLEGLSSN
jgi:hypothetical protein